jgi:ubiquitin-like-conjugating enzyme ATG3
MTVVDDCPKSRSFFFNMSVLGQLRAAREYMYPTRKTSGFLAKGVLTPEEFVIAGDELVFKCPTWQWESGDPQKRKPFLPDDKQYLITRNVPCMNRVSAMENMTTKENDNDEDGDWLISHMTRPQTLEDEFDILDDEGEVINLNKNKQADDVDNEYADIADFEDDNVLDDDDAAVQNPNEDNFVKVRTYDLSITYDKYYQTPRIWMVGYSTSQQPLSGPEMMEDVISDYANRTVTIENHPHVSGPHASIHPCQHGKVMKTIVRNLMKTAGEGDEGPSVNAYLFIFLKFVSSMIPTITYDFTMDVTASTSN